MRHSHDRSARSPRAYHCGRCRAAATRSDLACRQCRSPFVGPGRFDLLCGPSPSGSQAAAWSPAIVS